MHIHIHIYIYIQHYEADGRLDVPHHIPIHRPYSVYKTISGVTVVFQWGYSGVPVVFQWCDSGVTVV
jgi:hypothetical protein